MTWTDIAGARPELTDEATPYNPAAYIDLILRCATNLFLPFESDVNSLREPI
jgi:hypothetical protein